MARKSESDANSDAPKLETFYAADGTEYQCANRAEKTRLLMAGYTTEPPPNMYADAICLGNWSTVDALKMFFVPSALASTRP